VGALGFLRILGASGFLVEFFCKNSYANGSGSVGDCTARSTGEAISFTRASIADLGNP
jgi:hypothetical protein